MVDFSQFVFQPRPLPQYDFGRGFRTLIESRQNRDRIENQDAQAKAQLAEQQASRQDVNTRFAATEASSQRDKVYAQAQAKHNEVVKLTEQARLLAAQGHRAEARALLGRIAQLGGTVNEETGTDGQPAFTAKAPDAPGLPNVDYAGTRAQIFGGPAGNIGAPFVIRGAQQGEQNPFEYLPGASAAAMPQPSRAPDPPPGAAVEPPPPGAAADPSQGSSGAAPAGVGAIPTVPQGSVSPQDPTQGASPSPETQQGPGQALQLTEPSVAAGARNPFDPFRIDTGAIMRENRERLKPFLQGAQQAIPGTAKNRFSPFIQSVGDLGYSPEESVKLFQPTFGTLAGLVGDELRADASAVSASQRGQSMENTRNDRMVRNAQQWVNNLDTKYGLSKARQSWMDADTARSMLEERSPQADTQALSMIRNLYQSGVMTDKDFENTKSGAVRTLWTQLKQGATELFLQDGLNPDARAELLRVVELSKRGAEGKLKTGQTQMLGLLRNDRSGSQEYRDWVANQVGALIPEALHDPYLSDILGHPVEDKTGSVDPAGNYAVGPNKPGASGSSSVSARANRTYKGKALKDMTEEEMLNLPPDAAKELLGDD